jgi:hypothetical protein
MWSFVHGHFSQLTGTILPLLILLLDVIFKFALGNKDLHPFGGDMTLCGFSVYLGAVFHIVEIRRPLAGDALADVIIGIVVSVLAWIVTLYMGSRKKWYLSLLGAFLGIYVLSLCTGAAWAMLKSPL